MDVRLLMPVATKPGDKKVPQADIFDFYENFLGKPMPAPMFPPKEEPIGKPLTSIYEFHNNDVAIKVTSQYLWKLHTENSKHAFLGL